MTPSTPPTDLTSASVPAIAEDDHVRGEGPDAIFYLDLACPHCAATWSPLRALSLRICVRHFPMPKKHARGPALHAAVEAAGLHRGEAFWELCDRIYANLGRQDDPHLWAWARELGLDLDRFERDRRSQAVEARVRRDFESGIRAGVTGTPAAFVDGQMLARDVIADLPQLGNAGRS